LVYETNMMKLKCAGSKEECAEFTFGSMIDYDMGEYASKEIRFHTPGEHTIDDKKFDLEI